MVVRIYIYICMYILRERLIDVVMHVYVLMCACFFFVFFYLIAYQPL